MKLKAKVDMSLRKSADPKDPAYAEWHNWRAGDVFEAPSNLDVERTLERGLADVIGGKKDTDG